MTDFHSTGVRGKSVAAWVLSTAPSLPPGCLILDRSVSIVAMDNNDPWYWDVDRVVTELCTESQSWASITYSRRRPNPVSLEAALRDQEIDGSTLLIEVDDTVLKNELGIRVLGQLAPVKQIIRKLRSESARYIDWLGRYGSDVSLASHRPYGITTASNIRRRSQTPVFVNTATQATLPISPGRSHGVENNLGITVGNRAIHPQEYINEDSLHGDSWVSDATGSKRRRLNTEIDREFSEVQGDDELRSNHEFQVVAVSSILENELVQVQDDTPAPVLMVDDTLTKETTTPTKKRKRIAPTLITTEIDMNRDRGIPSQADMVIDNDPQNIEPGVIYVGDDGKKRLVPISQSGPDLDLPRRHQERLRNLDLAEGSALQKGGKQALEAAELILEAAKKNDNAACTEALSVGYLGKEKHSVSDIFYNSTSVGEELPPAGDEDKLPNLVTQGTISSGRRLYVHGLMKRFLHSERQIIRRNEKTFFAVRPYATRLAPMHQSPSFTLFHKGEDGEVHATRELLSRWPELGHPVSNNAVHSEEDDSRQAYFDLPDNLTLGGPSSYDSWDPDFLEKWRYIDGGDTVLPLYGDSDEEGEYDEETWNEIEAERGPLEKPLLPLRRAPLTYGEVNKAIDEGIAQIIVKWNEKELPKLQRRAWGLWKKARRDGNKRLLIRAAQEHITRLNDERLPQLRDKIHDQLWTTKKQVYNSTRNMEQSIADREERLWQISVLKYKVEPEKPTLRESKPKVSSPPLLLDDEGECILTDTGSGSFDDDDDFIDDDAISAEEGENRRADDEAEDLTMSDIATSSESGIDLPKRRVETSTKDTRKRSESPVQVTPVTRRLSYGDNVFTTEMPPVCDGDEMSSSLHTDFSSSRLPLCSANGGNREVKPSSPTASNGQINSSQDPTPDVIDLTLLSSDISEGDKCQQSSKTIDLITPVKPKNKIRLSFKRESPDPNQSNVIRLYDSDDTDVPENYLTLTDPAAISKVPRIYWEKANDKDRLLIGELFRMKPGLQEDLLELFAQLTPAQMWLAMVEVMQAFRDGKDRVRGRDSKTYDGLIGVMRFFEMYTQCHYRHPRPKLSAIEVDMIVKKEGLFQRFHGLVLKTLETLLGKSKDDVGDDQDSDPLLVVRRKYGSLSFSDVEGIEEDTPHKIRKRKIFENAQARDLREQDRQRLIEQEERRRILQHKLALSGNDVNSDRGRIIINDAKHDDQGFVYVHEQISKRIKDHQIEGVRFMWSQIVTNEDVIQGCLLAHTMGLGKTMQVITLLVAIAEAAQSPDISISSQVPLSLRVSKTLVLCPPSLIDNWMDELLMWAPPEILGEFRKVDSSVRSIEVRLDLIEKWFNNGGILLMGYEMFRRLIYNNATKVHKALLDEEEHARVRKQLLEGPNVIVADEAHKMKNALASITRAAANFRSKSRIALTGSPLANNIEEYHTMIEWIAPNYLGPITEFRAKYVEPIQQGLWSESTPYERRHSLKMLGVLREDLSPKVHRADISVLRKDLKPKTEFIITIPLTDLQQKAYSIYVKSMLGTDQITKDGQVPQTTLWHWLSVLSLLCNHPACFKAKLSERQGDAGNKSRGKLIAQKASTSEDDDIPDEIPVWKVGVSEGLVHQEMELFERFGSNIEALENSNKILLFHQILDASKAVGDKVLVFTNSIVTLDFLENLCKRSSRRYARLDGKTTMSKRQGETKEFNSGDSELYLISTTAGGLGLNLPGANRVIIFDFKFNPVNEEQAVGRAYRIGQNKPVFVYRFVVGGTFEEGIHNKTVFKMQLASRVVDKKNPIAWAKKRVGDFLFEPKAVKQQNLSDIRGMDPNVLDKILDGEGGSSIRAIVMTDTFERHDHDVLTAEEQKEVMQLLNEEKLKRSNKPAWEAEVRNRTSAMATAQQQSAQYVPPAAGKLPPFRAVQSQGQQINGSTRVLERPSIPLASSLRPQAPNTPNAQMPEMMPIAGANTKIRDSSPMPGALKPTNLSSLSTSTSDSGKAASCHDDMPKSSSNIRSSTLSDLVKSPILDGGSLNEEKQPVTSISDEASVKVATPKAPPVPAHKGPISNDQDVANRALRDGMKLSQKGNPTSSNMDNLIEKVAPLIGQEIKRTDPTRLTERSREIAKHMSQNPNLVRALISGRLSPSAIAAMSFINSAQITRDLGSLEDDSNLEVSPARRGEYNSRIGKALQATMIGKQVKVPISELANIANELVTAMAAMAKDSNAFEAAAHAALKEVTDHETCYRLIDGSLKPKDLAKTLIAYSTKPQAFAMDGSSDSPKSPSFSVPLRSKPPWGKNAQSLQAKSNRKSLEKVGRHSRISELKQDVKDVSPSLSPPRREIPLPGWAKNSIKRAHAKPQKARKQSSMIDLT